MLKERRLTGGLPVELLDRIFFFLDEPKDLLAAALASQGFRGIIIPSHLDYRRISCNLCSPAVWEALSSEPFAGSQIRSLDIIPDRDYTHSLAIIYPATAVPKPYRLLVNECSNDYATEVPLSLVKAIQCMPLLKRFRWLATDRPVAPVFQALHASCADIDEVEVLNWDGPDYSADVPSYNLADFKLWSLSNLTRFSYSQTSLAGDREAYIKFVPQLVDMLLHRCPGLQDLQLFFHYHSNYSRSLLKPPPYPIREMFSSAAWPKLKRLSVEECTLPYDTAGFFSRHPTIEALCITDGRRCKIDVSPLQCLHSLDLEWMPSIDEIPSGIAKNIRHFDGTLQEDTHGAHASTEDLEKAFLSTTLNLHSLVLRSEEFYPQTIKNLVHYVPTVRRLALFFDWPNYDMAPPEYKEVKAAYTAIFTSLPNLTHFSPVYLRYWAPWEGGDDDEDKEDESLRIDKTLRAILEISPNLCFVGIKSDGPNSEGEDPSWVVVEKDQDGGYQGFSWADRHRLRREIEVESWGDIYHGAGKDVIHRWYESF